MSMVKEGRQYQIVSVLGKGGFGTVYRAKLSTEGGFSKQVAIKILNPDAEGVAEFASRMRDEARLLGMINHRSIVQVDALVMLAGRWAVVMEYVEGVDLQALNKRGKVPVGPALEITREVAGALDVAYHGKGPDELPLKLLHRDIKLGNIRVTPAGEVKLLDFGIARADFHAREAKTTSLAFGTPDYMAPERLQFVDGPEGDVYAVGVVMFELLTGEHFGQTSLSPERHEAKVTAALDKVWTNTDGVSEELVRFVGQMLAFEPTDRPTHREVERMATELWRKIGTASLRDWAEEIIPTLTRGPTEAIPDDLAGQVLTEMTRSGAIPYPTAKLETDPPPPEPPVTSAPVSRPTATKPPVSRDPGPSQAQPLPGGGGDSGKMLLIGLVAVLGLLLLAAVGVGAYLLREPGSGGDHGDNGSDEGGASSGGGSSGGSASGSSGSSGGSSSGSGSSGGSGSGSGSSGGLGSSGGVASSSGGSGSSGGVASSSGGSGSSGGSSSGGSAPKVSTFEARGGWVRLIRGDDSYLPGQALSPGNYYVEVSWEGVPATRLKEHVKVRTGDSFLISCNKKQKDCTITRR